jgi:hypothetical protein
LPTSITDAIRGMRAYKDMTGVVFDVPEEFISRFDDIFHHLKEERRIDFEIGRAKSLPELKEDEQVPTGHNTRFHQGGSGGGG